MSAMGGWEAGVFDDPLAVDVRRRLERLLADGLALPDATQVVLREFADSTEDPVAGPAVWLALATLQAELGALQVGVRKRALAVILGGRGLEGWEARGPEALAARRAVLEELRWRLD